MIELFVLSAADEASLLEEARALATRIEQTPELDLSRVARGTREAPARGAERWALVAADRPSLLERLRAPKAGPLRGRALASRRVVMVFPGLGDHSLEMGLSLYQEQPVFRSAMDHARDVLSGELGVDILQVLYPRGVDVEPASSTGGLDFRKMVNREQAPASPAELQLGETRLLQPIMLAIEHALFELWASLGVTPKSVLGYSLGEYTAAVVAGVVSIDDALVLTARRARMIHALPPGAMLAVSLDEPTVEADLPGELSVSSVSGATMTVVAGPEDAVARYEAALSARQVISRRVKTTHAFHSKGMAPIAAAVSDLFRSVKLLPPAIGYVSNLTGAWITPEEAIDPGYWGRHLVERVRFAGGVHTLWADPSDVLLEVGPGQSLKSLALLNTARPDAPARLALATMRHPFERKPDREVLLETIGALFVAGVPLDLAAFDRHRPTAPVDLGAIAVASPAQKTAAASPAPETSRSSAPIADRIAGLMAELLRIARVDPDGDFLALGGNSLLAGQLVFQIRKAWKVTLPMRAVFEAPTPRALAMRVCDKLGAAPAPTTKEGLRQLPSGIWIEEQSRQETDYFYRDIWEERSYLRHGLSLPKNAVVLDVGANIGLFSMFAAKEAPEARILAFEPAPTLHAILSRNLARNAPRAKALCFGLGKTPGRQRFTFYPEASGMSSFHADFAEERAVLRAVVANELARTGQGALENTAEEQYLKQRLEPETLECEIRTLDRVMADEDLGRIDFLKIDVQKAELEVLEGLAPERFSAIAQVAMEAHDVDGRVRTLHDLLSSRGFSVTVQQDELYRGSNVHLLFARRPGALESV